MKNELAMTNKELNTLKRIHIMNIERFLSYSNIDLLIKFYGYIIFMRSLKDELYFTNKSRYHYYNDEICYLYENLDILNRIKVACICLK